MSQSFDQTITDLKEKVKYQLAVKDNAEQVAEKSRLEGLRQTGIADRAAETVKETYAAIRLLEGAFDGKP